MYRAYGLLKPDSDFNLDEAYADIVARFPGFAVARQGDRITISKGDWSIALALVSGPAIPEETQGITDRIAGLEETEAAEYKQSDSRVEISSEIPDPSMEHFNDFLSLVEVLKSFNGLLAVDPHQRALL